MVGVERESSVGGVWDIGAVRAFVRGSALGLLVTLAACAGSSSDGGGTGGEDDDGGPGGGPGNEPPAFLVDYGMNSSVNGWSDRTIAFADAMARASEFARVVDGSLVFDAVPLIPPGQPGAFWPDLSALPAGQTAAVRIFNDMAGSIPDGRTVPWVLTWFGTGSCRIFGQGVIGEANRTSNRVEVYIDPTVDGGDGTLHVGIDASSPSNPVRGVHAWLPGAEGSKPLFWPPFLNKLRSMNRGFGPHTWRSLNWNRTKEYGLTTGPAPFVFDLAGRITARSPSQGTRRGVCPEYQVALCNELGSNLHFPVPHRTDDLSPANYRTWLRDTLTVIRDGTPPVPGTNGGRAFEGLDPELVLVLEYSNEVWNDTFPVYDWIRDRAAATGRTVAAQIAAEMELVFTVADEVFSGADADRLELYLGGHVVDPSFLADILAELPPSRTVDQLGCASYIKPLNSTVSTWLVGADNDSCPNCPSPLQVIDAARQSLPIVRTGIRDHAALAASWTNPDGSHPRLVLYEGGQSFVAGFQPWADAASAAQSHAELFHLYVDEIVPMLVEEGVDLINWYSFMTSQSVQGGGGVGPFGHWDNMNQTITLPVTLPYVDEGAPKAAALCLGPPEADETP